MTIFIIVHGLFTFFVLVYDIDNTHISNASKLLCTYIGNSNSNKLNELFF